MVSGMLNWTGQAWIDAHVTIGLPTGRLPFPDGSFDLVYTSEVLVHVRPEDLEGRLRELVRVSRGQVLHIEPSDAAQICRQAHDGCWKHDLVAAYERMGISAQSLPGGYRLQRPTRVVLNEALVPYTWPAHILDMYRSFEQDMEGTIEGTIDELASTRACLVRAQDELAAQKASADAALADQIARTTALLAQGESQLQHERAEHAHMAQANAHAAEQARVLMARVHELELNLQLRERMMSAKASELAASILEAAALRTRLGEATQSAERLSRELGEARASHEAQQTSASEARDELQAQASDLRAQIAGLHAEVAALRAEREADQQTFRARAAELELEALRQRLATDYYKGIKERFVAAVAPVIGL
jgi:SAM-dependent methyltransferase